MMTRPPAKGTPAARPHTGVDQRLASLIAPTSFAAEQYRVLRHAIAERQKEAGLRVVAVASATVGEGKTTTAINLAGSLAHAPATRVLLIDADLRRPCVGARLGLNDAAGGGLVEAILDASVPLERVVQHCPAFNLSVIPAGRHTARAYELLESPRFGDLVSQARERYDYVVLDTPPLVPVSDCRLITHWTDGVLVVVSAHRTPRRLVEEALRVIDPPKMIGFIFNNDDRPFFGYYGAYGTYSAYTPSEHERWTTWWKPPFIWRRRLNHVD
jgi:succinoglycan biosynthesis transport protein ExoP